MCAASPTLAPRQNESVIVDDPLLPHHRHMLEVDSGISPDVIKAREYRSITTVEELAALGFKDYQRRVPALYLPTWSAINCEIVGGQIRPDDPRVDRSSGKPIKYESPAGSTPCLDVNPRMHAEALTPWAPLWITEGKRKADALASRGEVAVSIDGVYGWRLRNEQGESVPNSDFQKLLLQGRPVYIAFDSDVARNPQVRRALEALNRHLESLGAVARIVLLPNDSQKIGVDEFLAEGRTIDDLIRLSHPAREAFTSLSLSQPESVPSTGSGLEFRTLRELAEQSPDEPPWLVEGLISSGAITELSGPVKTSGKTTFALALSKAVTTGQPFLDLPVVRGPIVYLTEQGVISFKQQARKADLLNEDDVHVLPWTDAAREPWDNVIAQAIQCALTRGARLLIVDTLSQWAGLRGDNENDSGAAMEALKPLQVAAAQGLGVLVIRHDRKGGGPVGESARGSSAFTGGVDIVLQLGRPEGNHSGEPTLRMVKALSRFDGTPERLTIDFRDGRYSRVGDFDAVKTVSAREAILRAAPDREDAAMSTEELYQAAKVKGSTAAEPLKDLVNEGFLKMKGKGAKGSPHRYWKSNAGIPFSPSDPSIGVSDEYKENGGVETIDSSGTPRSSGRINGQESRLRAEIHSSGTHNLGDEPNQKPASLYVDLRQNDKSVGDPFRAICRTAGAQVEVNPLGSSIPPRPPDGSGVVLCNGCGLARGTGERCPSCGATHVKIA